MIYEAVGDWACSGRGCAHFKWPGFDPSIKDIPPRTKNVARGGWVSGQRAFGRGKLENNKFISPTCQILIREEQYHRAFLKK